MSDTHLTVQFAGRTYRIGDMDVPVMRVNQGDQTVCLKVGSEMVWVKATDINRSGKPLQSVEERNRRLRAASETLGRRTEELDRSLDLLKMESR